VVQGRGEFRGGCKNELVNSKVIKRVQNGRSTSFLGDCWMSNTLLWVSFPRLYSISTKTDARVGKL